MKSAVIFLFLSTIAALFYFFGVLFFLTDHEPHDNCEMTYMFEYPQYVRIVQSIDQKYPKYGLYAYAEGRLTSKARNMDFDGIPVLFVPGNAGSYQQVRSLASVALRKALNSRTKYHFDYFTVNLNSEYSALYGLLLNDQLEYVNHSIYRVLELYKRNASPAKQVILIGHSIGGLVAKNIQSDIVPIIIALSAPFKRPVIAFDRYLQQFYEMNTKQSSNTSVFSIAGGFSDFLIPTYLTQSIDNDSTNLVTTNVPLSWVEAGHVQIVWCKQTVLAINRALFDIVDYKTKQISTNKTLRENIFKHHLIKNSGTKLYFKSNYLSLTKLNYDGEWIENLNRQYTIHWPKGIKRLHWYMVGLTSQANYEVLTILAINLEVPEWIYACNAAYPKGSSRVCINGFPLSQMSEIVPSARHKRRLITVNLHQLRQNNSDLTHVVFSALPTSEPLIFHVDVYSRTERKQTCSLPTWPFKKYVLVSETPRNAIVYNLELSDLTNLLQFYQIFIEPVLGCSVAEYQVTVTLIVPWYNQNVHQHFTESLNKPFNLRLQTVKPQNSEPAWLRITLDPSCTYKISSKIHIIGTFGLIARLYSPLLISNVVIVVLLTFQHQLRQINDSGTCPVFFRSLLASLKYAGVLILSAILCILLSYSMYVPTPDTMFFPNGGDVITDFVLIPILMYMIGNIIVLILATAYCISLFFLESTVHKLIAKVVAKTVPFRVSLSDYFLSFLQKVPFVAVGALILLCLTTCGGLALCVGMVFYFLKLTQMSQDYVEEVIWSVINSAAKKCKNALIQRHDKVETLKTNKDATNEQNDAIFFHSSLFFIWVLVTALNVPAVLTWAHNFKYSKTLTPDVSFMPGLVLSACALPLWHLDLPRTNKKYSYVLPSIVLGLVIYCYIYATISIYRLNYALTFIFALVTIQQAFAVLSDMEEDDKNHRTKYEQMKMKLE